MRWPRSLKRAAESPAPMKTTTASARAPACNHRRKDLLGTGNWLPGTVLISITCPGVSRFAHRCDDGNLHGDGVWHERDDGAEDHDDQADPDPRNQRIHMGFDDGASGGFVLAFINQIEIAHQKKIFAKARINSRQGLRLLAGFIEAALRIHCRNLFAASKHVDNGPLIAVIGIVILRERLADQRVGTNKDLFPKSHFFFDFFIKRSAEDSDDYQRDAEVDDVSAIAAGVAAAQLNHRGEKILISLSRDNAPSPKKFGDDGED